jgi:hypothetical protein
MLLRCAALSVALAGSTLAACSSAQSSSAPTMKEIRALLARHGAAVMQHDRAQFVADLDPVGKSTTFRDAQEGAFDNLAKLPLTSWSYQVATRTDDREFETSASKRYGTPAVIVRITLKYALRGVDPVPTSHDLWWTFVRHHGNVVVAGDSDLAAAGGTSWQGPWDFGPLEVVRGTHSLVLGHSDNSAALRSIATAVDAAVPAVTAVWGTGWTRDVAVIVPSSPDELSAQAGASSQVSTQVAAAAISDGQDPLSGTVYGQRLIVNPAALRRLSAVGQQITIRHEITHLATARVTSDASPRWVVEGFADYVGNLGSGQPPTVVAAELRADVRRGKAPAALPGEAAFDTDGEAAQAYEGAWLACRLIAQRAGQAGLVRFYRLVGTSHGDPEQAVSAALHTVLHETTAQFTAQWRDYVRATLR